MGGLALKVVSKKGKDKLQDVNYNLFDVLIKPLLPK
jgi:hypothetical protein